MYYCSQLGVLLLKGLDPCHAGDLARWLPDGNIEFLGRIDSQVLLCVASFGQQCCKCLAMKPAHSLPFFCPFLPTNSLMLTISIRSAQTRLAGKNGASGLQCRMFDVQVKVRGFRIELGEIENVLARAGNVQLAVVKVITDKAQAQHLVAYLSPASVDAEAIKAAAAKSLPGA